MRLIVSAKNADKITSILASVNGRASTWTIDHGGVVIALAKKFEEDLAERGLPKKHQRGARVAYVPAGPGTKAYKYYAISTRLTLERRAGGWALTDVKRVSVTPTEGERVSFTLTPAQAEKITAHALRGCRVTPPAEA